MQQHNAAAMRQHGGPPLPPRTARLRAVPACSLFIALSCADVNRTANQSDAQTAITIDVGAYTSAHQFVLRESLRIGDENDGVIFARVSDVSTSRNGDVYVADAGNHQIWVFDQGGQLLRRFGRQGEGPGEFPGTFPARLAIADDTVFVLDKYLHAFSLTGAFLYSVGVRAQSERVLRPPLAIVGTSAGLISAWSHRSGTRALVDGEIEEDTMWMLTRPSNSPTFDGSAFALAGPRKRAIATTFGTSLVAMELGTGPQLAIAPTGHVYYSRGTEYAIDQFDHAGTPVARLTADVDPVPIARARSDSIRQANLERTRTRPYPSEEMRRRSIEVLERTPTVRYRQILGRLVAGDSGVLLVERLDLEATDTSAFSNWDVLQVATGKLLGRLQLPLSFTPYALRNWRLYGTDYKVVPQVVRFDIVR